MPLFVELAINDKPIQNIRISRQEKLRAKDRWYTYVVTSAKEGGSHESATFQHQYSQGAEECVRRALEALASARETRNRDSLR